MNLASRIWTFFLGATIASAGALFVWYLYSAWEKASLTNDWIERPASIIVSTLDDSQLNRHGMTKYILQVRYAYEYEGERYLSDQIRRNMTVESGSLKAIGKKAERYPPGTETVCFVNPDDPAEAILKKDTKAALKSIWFPGIFVIGGVGIAAAAFRPRPKRV